MKKFFFLVLIPAFCNANTSTVFKSSCSGIQYSIESFCSVNNLKDDQDKLDIPICGKQTFVLGKENHDLSKSTGFVEQINSKGEKIKMMNFVFYGASCKNDRIILSGSGGCNSCGETLKTFNLSGKEIKEKSTTLDLEPMQDIIPNFY
ncbi:hypothetical protein NVX15_004292 [Salmonella enterica]|nr:hypothetical protein [Salmonella enterica subsp. enterica serovar Newport]ECU0903394.1 hypothetical protein [Salmonella enterica]EDI8917184.1 hypothetical protein [Salmonella enterica]EDX9925560.1 hypothetical protein [Salmonella enterica]EEE8671061.1 hypothetical protein [Salmonella enterica]